MAQSVKRLTSAQVLRDLTVRDLTMRGFEPPVGLCTDSLEPGARFRFCVSTPPLLMLCLSLSVNNK